MIVTSKRVLIAVDIPTRDSELLLTAFTIYYQATREEILEGYRTIEFSRRRGLFFLLLIKELGYNRTAISAEYKISRTTVTSIISTVEFEINKYTQLRIDQQNVLKIYKQIVEGVAKVTEQGS